ncbi:MAG: AAA family ATPase [Actinobacteria bacterium]|nr:AAA family ATPase [Actinomycetota bacterium]
MNHDVRAIAIREEQRHVDRAYARLEELRRRAERRRQQALAAPVVTHADLVDRDAAAFQAAARVTSLSIGDTEPLVFGRLDRDDGETYHVGRVSVLSQDYEPLVVDWRSDVAAAFYRATLADPQGVRRRRIIHCRGRTVLTVEDQLLGGDGDARIDLVGDAALMAALTRDRSDRMRDIVATIQREQDEIIRQPARGVVVVSGGPGTGKTVVALHRVAYLLYRHRERLERRGVLIVGPTRAFADYIASVLPSLGETTAVLQPLGAFVPGLVTDRHDQRDVAAIKGDPRMGEVMRRYAARLPRGASWRGAFDRLRSGEVDVSGLAGGVLTAEQARTVAAAWRGDHAAGRLPSVDDVALIDELRVNLGSFGVSGPPAADGADEPAVTTFADRSVRVDPGELINAPDYSEFGHVVVDEAQDLSFMQWRMVARRGHRATWTVVGDLAQRSTLAGPSTWIDVGRLVGRREVEVARLTVNYRTSARIMDLAARLLMVTAPDQRPPRSVRIGEHDPSIITGLSDLADAAAGEARRAREAVTGTVAVVAAGAVLPELAQRLVDDDVRVFDPWTVKGLEFDAVVVTDPDAIVATAGYGSLYVALTRATDRLSVVTAGQDLPGPLAGSDAVHAAG